MNRGYALYAAVTLAVTGWALLATPVTTATNATCSAQAAWDYRWNVVGDCGLSGPLHIGSEGSANCSTASVVVEGGTELLVPDNYVGTAADLNAGGWSLIGDVLVPEARDTRDGGVDDDGGTFRREHHDCEAARTDGGLTLECWDNPSWFGRSRLLDASMRATPFCTYALTPE